MNCPQPPQDAQPERPRSETWSMPPFEFIVEAINEGVLLCDLHGAIFYVNQRMAEMLGYPVEAIIGADLFEFMAFEWAKAASNNLKRRARGVAEIFEHEFLHHDGHAIQTLVASRPIRIENQQSYEASLVAITDISERAQTIEMLRRSEESFRTLSENSPDGILIHRGQEIIYANPAMARLLGYDGPRELYTIQVRDFVRDEDIARLPSRIANADPDTSITSFKEHPLRRKDGSLISVETAHYKGIYANQAAVISLSRDITARKELQSKAMQLDRMLAAGTLAAGIGHEINNPLAFVSGHLDLALAEVKDCLALIDLQKPGEALDPAERQDLLDSLRDVQHSLEVARRGSTRIRDIVESLRLFTREEYESPYPVDLVEVLESTIQMLGDELPENTRIVRDFQCDSPIIGYESGLGQVLLNLLINAAQALHDTPPTAREIQILTYQTQDAIAVEVRDTGSGIHPDKIAHIFEPFFTTKSPDVGTGLGLTISRKLMERMGGTLEVAPREIRGTCVTLHLKPAR